MLIIEDLRDALLKSNVEILMRERGKIVPGSHRIGHNIVTTVGRNFITKAIAWQTIGAVDIPYTNRRVRWMGVGSGSQLEVATVSQLLQPVLATATDYLRPIQSVEFPTSTSVRFTREFGTTEVNLTGLPVNITEAALYADVVPSNNGAVEDVSYDPVDFPAASMLNPALGTNPPIAYKAFDGLSKTRDFTFEIRWEIRLG